MGKSGRLYMGSAVNRSQRPKLSAELRKERKIASDEARALLLTDLVQEHARLSESLKALATKHGHSIDYMWTWFGVHGPELRSARKPSNWNGFLIVRAPQVNQEREKEGLSKLKIHELGKALAEEYATLTEEEQDKYAAFAEQARDDMAPTALKLEADAIVDINRTMSQMMDIAERLYKRTHFIVGMQGIAGSSEIRADPFTYTPQPIKGFYESLFRYSDVDITMRMAHYALRGLDGAVSSARQTHDTLKKDIVTMIITRIRAISQRRSDTLPVMNYVNYFKKIVTEHRVWLIGWRPDVRFLNPSDLNKSEVERHHDALLRNLTYFVPLTEEEYKEKLRLHDDAMAEGRVFIPYDVLDLKDDYVKDVLSGKIVAEINVKGLNRDTTARTENNNLADSAGTSDSHSVSDPAMELDLQADSGEHGDGVASEGVSLSDRDMVDTLPSTSTIVTDTPPSAGVVVDTPPSAGVVVDTPLSGGIVTNTPPSAGIVALSNLGFQPPIPTLPNQEGVSIGSACNPLISSSNAGNFGMLSSGHSSTSHSPFAARDVNTATDWGNLSRAQLHQTALQPTVHLIQNYSPISDIDGQLDPQLLADLNNFGIEGGHTGFESSSSIMDFNDSGFPMLQNMGFNFDLEFDKINWNVCTE